MNNDLCGNWDTEGKSIESSTACTACTNAASTSQRALLSACEAIVATNARNIAEAHGEFSSAKSVLVTDLE